MPVGSDVKVVGAEGHLLGSAPPGGPAKQDDDTDDDAVTTRQWGRV